MLDKKYKCLINKEPIEVIILMSFIDDILYLEHCKFTRKRNISTLK